MHTNSMNSSDQASGTANAIPHANVPAILQANLHAKLQADLPPPKNSAPS
jgi:hypothetical protein